MKKASWKSSFLLSIFLFSLCINAVGRSFNPLHFGLLKAHTGEERYWILYKTHLEAFKYNGIVDYGGVDTIEIDIPKDAKPIPLTGATDFKGAALIVGCNHADALLFELKQKSDPIEIEKKDVAEGNYIYKEELRKGLFLLILKDENPWVLQRKGYKYGHIRKDVVVVKDGRGENSTITDYNNDYTTVSATFCPVTSQKKTIENLVVYRKKGNSKIAYVIGVNNQYNVHFRNIEIHTPNDSLVRDYIIRVDNSAKIQFNNISIDGTYSRKNMVGYGISLNNVYDVSFIGLKAEANWGVFGNNNLNHVTLKHCDINRFDIHCYGKDIDISNCTFRNLYNQFSSIYGTISFQDCDFINFTPVLFENSYNAFTKFKLLFKDCRIVADKAHNFLIRANDLDRANLNERFELRKKEYPDLYIDGLTILMSKDISEYYIYKFYSNQLKWPRDTIPHLKRARKIRQMNKYN